MIQELKELLLKDLCGRLPYDIIVKDEYGDYIEVNIYTANLEHLIDRVSEGIVKMVLRPMSSMTEEERKEYTSYCFEQPFLQKGKTPNLGSVPMCIDWLNEHHFDYRGLIEKDLAIEVTEENNSYESTSETY